MHRLATLVAPLVGVAVASIHCVSTTPEPMGEPAPIVPAAAEEAALASVVVLGRRFAGSSPAERVRWNEEHAGEVWVSGSGQVQSILTAGREEPRPLLIVSLNIEPGLIVLVTYPDDSAHAWVRAIQARQTVDFEGQLTRLDHEGDKKRVIGVVRAVSKQDVLLARAKEAQVVLRELLWPQVSFKKAMGSFATVNPNPPGSPGARLRMWAPRDCNQACAPEATDSCTEFSCIGYEPAGKLRYTYACSGTKTAFTCAAAGDLDGDGTLKMFVWATAPKGQPRAPIPAIGPLGRCKLDEPPLEFTDCDPSEW